MPMRESAVEAALVRHARAQGIWTRKFSSPAHAGVPDRIFMYNGKVLFMEVKRPGEKPTKLQLYELEQIKAAGGLGVWVDNVAEGKSWLDNYVMLS